MGSRRIRLGSLAAMAVLMSGCAQAATTDSTDTKASSTPHEMSQDMSMPGMEMGSMVDGPSAPARMICSDEIADAVTTTFGLASSPSARDSWSQPVYTCTYRLPSGMLVLSVQDSSDATAGRVYFDQLQRRV
ncbi:MAG: hypothetical protein ABJA81_09215, partial [Nocardioidaceae bacterium]